MVSLELTLAMSASYLVKMAGLLATLIAPVNALEKPSWTSVVHVMEETQICQQTEHWIFVGSAVEITPLAMAVMGRWLVSLKS